MGKITIKGMRFSAYHGVYEQEQKIGNTFIVDISFEYDSIEAQQTDDFNKSIDYQTVYEITKKEMQKPSKLIENLAFRVKNGIEKEFDVKNLIVTIYKQNPPIANSEIDAVIFKC